MEIYRPDRGNPSVELRMVTFTRSALVQSSMVPAKRSMKASLSLLYTWTFTVLGVVAICDMWWYGTSKGCFRFISLGFNFVVFVTSLIYSPEFTGNLGIWWNGTTQPEGNKPTSSQRSYATKTWVSKSELLVKFLFGCGNCVKGDQVKYLNLVGLL